MRRVLLWSRLRFNQQSSVKQVLLNNEIAANSGNVLFHTSMARAMMTEDTTIDTCFLTEADVTEAFVRQVNETCDCFVMPLANAFRDEYLGRLRALTALLRRLRIPCVVAGVGVQAMDVEEMRRGLNCDDDVRAFLRAALDHSAVIGLRGEFTAEYLKKLGFAPERHFTVIGCPSMYMFGSELPEISKRSLCADSKVCINAKAASRPEIHELMARSCADLPNYWYVPQRIEEFWMLYYGPARRRMQRVPDYFPMTRRSAVLDRAIGFLNAPSWLEFMRGIDFSYGCNIHGNLAAILAGVPAVVIEKDLRVAEIARYFEVPRVSMDEISRTRSILDVYERADYAPVEARHGQRFQHFVDFLNANGLEHIYRAGGKVDDAPLDRLFQRVGWQPPVTARRRIGLAGRVEALPVYREVFAEYLASIRRRLRRH